jgi:YegS/Rv2252/BmrU family lipid kinase
MKHHFHLIINSNAGEGRGKKIGNRLLEILTLRKENYTAYFTSYAGEEVKIARELATTELRPWRTIEATAEFPLLVVLGGDGTLHQVLNAIEKIDNRIPVAYIPAGSGNDFARGVGLSRNPDDAFDAILNAREPRELYVGTYEDVANQTEGLFVNNFGIGFDASVVHATNASTAKKTLNKYKLGSLAYLYSVLGVLFRQKGFPLTIETADASLTTDNAFLATVTNHPYFGGGVAIAPTAKAGDKELDLIVIDRPNFLRLLCIILLLLRGKHLESKFVKHLRAEEFTISSTSAQYGQIDGETLGRHNYDLKIASRRVLFWF